MAKILKGNDLLLYTKSGEDYIVYARANSCNLEISSESQEVSTKESGEFKEFIKGKIDWSVSVDGMVTFETGGANGFLALNKALFSGEKIDIAIGVTTLPQVTADQPVLVTSKPLDKTAFYYTGKVTVESISLNTGNAGELSSYSASLKGDGVLTSNYSA